MSEPELDQRKQDLAELGEIISQRHEHRLSSEGSDPSTLSFSRYLRASRENAGLSVTELAHRTNLSPAALLALEQGLFAATAIPPPWLNKLAAALDENVEDFYIILGVQVPGRRPLLPQFQTWPFRFGPRRPAHKSRWSLIPVYAIGSVLLISLTIITFINYAIFSTPAPVPEKIPTFIYISSERRLNMIKAEPVFEYQLISLPTDSSTKAKPCCAY